MWFSNIFISFKVALSRGSGEVLRLFSFIGNLHKHGLSVSLDNVGDASLSLNDAKVYRSYYIALIKQFARGGEGDELCMSIKLSALTYDLEIVISV